MKDKWARILLWLLFNVFRHSQSLPGPNASTGAGNVIHTGARLSAVEPFPSRPSSELGDWHPGTVMQFPREKTNVMNF